MVPRQVLDYVKKLSVGDHAVLFYDVAEDGLEVLFTFLKDGLRRGEEAVYITDVEAADVVRDAMESFGIDPFRVTIIDQAAMEEARRKGNLLGLGIEWSPTGIIEFWRRRLHRAPGRAARLAANMEFKTREPEFQLDLERSFGRRLDVPMTMICAYPQRGVNARDREGNLFFSLIKAHSHGIFPGIALKLG